MFHLENSFSHVLLTRITTLFQNFVAKLGKKTARGEEKVKYKVVK